IPATPKINVANLRRLQYGMTSSGVRSCVRFRPSGVISKAHEMNTATKKPSASNTTNAVMIDSGASTNGKSTDAISISSHAITTYGRATLNTLRRLSSENNDGLLLMALWVNRLWRPSSCIGDHRASRVITDLLKARASRHRDHQTRFATIRKLYLFRRARRKP